MNPVLERYRSAILDVLPSDGPSRDLLISRSEQLSAYYAPFEHVNTRPASSLSDGKTG